MNDGGPSEQPSPARRLLYLEAVGEDWDGTFRPIAELTVLRRGPTYRLKGGVVQRIEESDLGTDY